MGQKLRTFRRQIRRIFQKCKTCFGNLNSFLVTHGQHGQSNGSGITYFLDGGVHHVQRTRQPSTKIVCSHLGYYGCRAHMWMEQCKARALEYFKTDLATRAPGKMICCKGKLYIWGQLMPSERQYIHLKKVSAFPQESLIEAWTGTPSRLRLEDSKLVE